MHCQQQQATSPVTAIHHNMRRLLEPSQRALFNNTYTEIEMKLDNDSSSSTPAKQYPAVLPPTSHSAVLPYLNSQPLVPLGDACNNQLLNSSQAGLLQYNNQQNATTIGIAHHHSCIITNTTATRIYTTSRQIHKRCIEYIRLHFST